MGLIILLGVAMFAVLLVGGWLLLGLLSYEPRRRDGIPFCDRE